MSRLLSDADALLSDGFVKSICFEALLGAIESEDVSRHPPGENRYIAAVAQMIGAGAARHPLNQLPHDGFTTNWDPLIQNAGAGLAEASVAGDEESFRRTSAGARAGL